MINFSIIIVFGVYSANIMITPGKQKTGGTAPGDTNKRNKNEQKMKKRERIIPPHGAIRKIAKETGFSTNTVSLALKGVTDSENADKIRKVAKKYL